MNAFQHAAKKGSTYLNNELTNSIRPGTFFSTLWSYLVSKEERFPKKKPGPFVTDQSIYRLPPLSGLRVTWFGHSSVLIEMAGLRILTDPVWSERVSFSSMIGPRRFFEPPLDLEDLPELDAIIISHDHYDHFDKPTIIQLGKKNIPFYCSEGVGAYLKKWGVPSNLVTELNWGDAASIAGKLTLTATPARHFSGRGIFNRNQTLWSSFVLQSQKHTVFFGADSGWTADFAKIGEAFGPFDLTLLEIGASHQNWADIHMGPDKAADAHLALKGRLLLPIHWGTFNLALHAWTQPVERLIEVSREKNIPLLLPVPGQPVEINGQPQNSWWWRSGK